MITKQIKVLPINLQLFGEDDGANTESDVVDYSQEPDVDGEVEEFEDVELDEEEEVVEPQEDVEEEEPQQTPEENAQFKKMRIKAEEQARKKLEAERAEIMRMKEEIEQKKAEDKLRNEYLSQQKVWDKADEEGVSEDTARKMLELELKEVIRSEREKVKQRFDELQAQKAKYQKDPYFNVINEQAEIALRNNPTLTYDTAYKYYRGEMALNGDLSKEQEKKTVRRTLANVQDSMRRRSVPTTGGDSINDTAILSKEGKEMASAFGVDPRRVAKRIKEAKLQTKRR